MGWLASARVAWGQQGAPTDNAKAPAGPDAAKPVVEGPATPPPPGPTPAELALKAQQADLEALKAEQGRLREELEMMNSILGAEREQRAEEVIGLREKADSAALLLQKPPAWTAKGGVGFTGFLQADWGAWRQSSEDQVNPSTLLPLNEERFMIRRARLRTIIEKTYVGGALEFDGNTVNGSTARIVGAEASIKLPGEDGAPMPLLMASIGLFKIPFGFEVVQSDRDRIFMERSRAEQALFPGEYDVGARLLGGWRFVRYVIAVQNGNPLGERAFPGRDPNSAKDLTGRVGVETGVTDNVSLVAGFSGLKGTGFHRGTPATKPTIQWSDRNENGQFDQGEIVTTPGSSASDSQNFSRFAYGVDAGLTMALPPTLRATVYGELYLAKNLDRALVVADPITGRDLRELGYYVAGLLDVGEWVTVGARWDSYNPDRDSTDSAKPLVPTDLSFNTVSVVAALRHPSGRLSVEYDHNSNHLGRDASGSVTSLKDDTIVVRGQVQF